jgi:hypothetical protein
MYAKLHEILTETILIGCQKSQSLNVVFWKLFLGRIALHKLTYTLLR